MNTDGSPSEMFLPWRTIASNLAGATYVGELSLPNGSRNEVFARDGKAVMVVWNEVPTEEILYLGEQVRQSDLWSRELPPDSQGNRSVLEVGPLPSIVTGVNLAVARWRMSLTIKNDRLASIFGRTQNATIQFKNTFEQGVGGSVTTFTPKDWRLESKKQMLSAAVDEEVASSIKIQLRNGASSGAQKVRFDFSIDADQPYDFSVYREMHVGLGDLEIRLQAYLNDQGALVVRQEFENHSQEQVSFDCQLFAPDRRRQRVQIFRQGQGVTVRTFQLPDGHELIGKELWLRAEEVRGERILNSRIIAQP